MKVIKTDMQLMLRQVTTEKFVYDKEEPNRILRRVTTIESYQAGPLARQDRIGEAQGDSGICECEDDSGAEQI